MIAQSDHFRFKLHFNAIQSSGHMSALFQYSNQSTNYDDFNDKRTKLKVGVFISVPSTQKSTVLLLLPHAYIQQLL